MKLVYVAGPYRAPTIREIEHNIAKAEDAGVTIVTLGAYPVIPHANTRACFQGTATDGFFLEGTMELMRRCDAVLVIGDSPGTRAEVREAEKLKIPVFEKRTDLLKWLSAPLPANRDPWSNYDEGYTEGHHKGWEDGSVDGRSARQRDVEEFHEEVIGLSAAPTADFSSSAIRGRRARLIAEESAETVAALIGGFEAGALFFGMTKKVLNVEPSLAGYLDGRIDTEVVLHGSDLELGVWGAVDEAWDLVHASNMAKTGGPKDPLTGKQLKPEGWTPPDIEGLLERNRRSAPR